ncbi:MAG: hypothetical protein QOE83_1147 [Actinomycetota bacterium]|nr:hypothetical protein [Actinomycetota bacterium]
MRRTSALAAILVILCAGCGAPSVLEGKGLSQEAGTLQSSAAEGALLAQDVASGRTIPVYVREHASDLATAVSQSLSTLEAVQTEPSLRSSLRRLTNLAGSIHRDLELLGTADREESAALVRRLEAEAQAGEQIAAGLS